MKREELSELIARAAAAQGYAFHTGEGHIIGARVAAYPAAWLAPAVVKSKTGRTEGTVVWRVTLHLMALPSSQSHEGEWKRLTRDGLSIVATVACESGVLAVDNVSATPARGALTPHGELSVTLVADITMWYSV